MHGKTELKGLTFCGMESNNDICMPVAEDSTNRSIWMAGLSRMAIAWQFSPWCSGSSRMIQASGVIISPPAIADLEKEGATKTIAEISKQRGLQIQIDIVSRQCHSCREGTKKINSPVDPGRGRLCLPSAQKRSLRAPHDIQQTAVQRIGHFVDV